MQVTPYINKRWYGGGLNGGDSLKQYTDTYGASLSMGYWLNQNFKYSALYNFGYERYRKEVDKLNYNGAVHSLTNSLMFIPSSTQFWSISLDLTKKYAADRSNAYNRIGTRLTWGQEWPLGITTSTTLGYAKRHYLEQSFIGMKQRNNEYSASVSLWHKVIWRFIHTIKTKSLSKWVKVSKCKKVGFQKNPTFLLSTIFEIIYFCSLSHKSAYFTKVEWAESTASRKPCFPSKKPAFKMYIFTKQPMA